MINKGKAKNYVTITFNILLINRVNFKSVHVGPKMTHLPHFRHNKKSPQKSTFTSSLMPFIRHNCRKIYWTDLEQTSAVSVLGPMMLPLPHFGDKIFLKNGVRSLLCNYWTLTLGKKSRNSNEPILRKGCYRWTNGWRDGRTELNS